jgi:glycosyltransferase involved in cell wall biosynthesis
MLTRLYYRIKPLIPRRAQIGLRRIMVKRKRARYANVWPIDERAGKAPEGWTGWPEGKKFALVLTHDVETAKGQENCRQLMELEEKLGFRSSFGFVPERYPVSAELRKDLERRGFEVAVHGLLHDGLYYKSRETFSARAVRINRYIKDWGAAGFRSPSMHHNLDWIHDLNVEYDSSTFDTDPFEPQSDGVGTIFPFWVRKNSGEKGYLELPYTLCQDHTLVVIMQERSIDIWKKKLDWIAEKGGMALLICHPDYMHFGDGNPSPEEYPARYYEELLKYAGSKYEGQYWHVLPKEINRYRSGPYLKHGDRDPAIIGKKKEAAEKQARRNLRVAMLSYSFYDSDARVSRYAETLARRGDHVDVFALGQNGQDSFSVINGVNVYRIQTRERNERGKFSFLARILRFFIKSAFFLGRKHLRNSYDLVHVHSVPDFEVFAAWIPKLGGAKLILDIHDILPEFYASKFKTGNDSLVYRILLLAEKFSAAFSDHVIISNHIWEKTICRSVTNGKCSTILNYPDQEIFYKRPRRRSDDKFIMLYPGTLNWHQGLDIAVRAFGRVAAQMPHAEFHIYGNGDTRDLLEKLIDQLKLSDKVLLHEPLPKEMIADVIADADLGVVPKRDDSFGGEAFSTKTLEFMSLGVPIIISATKIDRYYFNDSVVKFFEPENDADLAEKMLLLIKNNGMREQLSQNALRFVADYSWDNKKQEYLTLVDSLVRKDLTVVK